ncbi:MAG: hypothetical protein Q4C70_06630 [Planctomycetia bacterium]|nr:hypothetical protein [Planctomycetia bacterium]
MIRYYLISLLIVTSLSIPFAWSLYKMSSIPTSSPTSGNVQNVENVGNAEMSGPTVSVKVRVYPERVKDAEKHWYNDLDAHKTIIPSSLIIEPILGNLETLDLACLRGVEDKKWWFCENLRVTTPEPTLVVISLPVPEKCEVEEVEKIKEALSLVREAYIQEIAGVNRDLNTMKLGIFTRSYQNLEKRHVQLAKQCENRANRLEIDVESVAETLKWAWEKDWERKKVRNQEINFEKCTELLTAPDFLEGDKLPPAGKTLTEEQTENVVRFLTVLALGEKSEIVEIERKSWEYQYSLEHDFVTEEENQSGLLSEMKFVAEKYTEEFTGEMQLVREKMTPEVWQKEEAKLELEAGKPAEARYVAEMLRTLRLELKEKMETARADFEGRERAYHEKMASATKDELSVWELWETLQRQKVMLGILEKEREKRENAIKEELFLEAVGEPEFKN